MSAGTRGLLAVAGPALALAAAKVLAARSGEPTGLLLALAAGQALAGWLAGMGGPPQAPRALPVLAGFGLAGLLAGLALPWELPGPPAAVRPAAGLVDGLASGAVWLAFARAGRGMAERQGLADALAAWAAGVASSGAALWLVWAAWRSAAGAPLPGGGWPAAVAGWAAAVAAGAWLLPRQGWSTTTFDLMFAMLPAFAGLWGVAEAALVLPPGEARFAPGFIALTFVPIWLAAGLGFYVAGLLGALLAMLLAARRGG